MYTVIIMYNIFAMIALIKMHCCFNEPHLPATTGQQVSYY